MVTTIRAALRGEIEKADVTAAGFVQDKQSTEYSVCLWCLCNRLVECGTISLSAQILILPSEAGSGIDETIYKRPSLASASPLFLILASVYLSQLDPTMGIILVGMAVIFRIHIIIMELLNQFSGW